MRIFLRASNSSFLQKFKEFPIALSIVWLKGVFLYRGVIALEEDTKITGVDFFNELVWYMMGFKDMFLSCILFK